MLQLKDNDYSRLNRAPIEEGGVKVVLGPGTGHGQGYLVKSKFSPCYEVFPSEGGHVEFAPRDEVDMRLLQFMEQTVPCTGMAARARKTKVGSWKHIRFNS